MLSAGKRLRTACRMFGGDPSQQVTEIFTNAWFHSPKMTLVHDSHRGYTAQPWPTLWRPKELQCDICSPLSLGGRALPPPLSGSSHGTLSNAGQQWSPACSLERKPSFYTSRWWGSDGPLRAWGHGELPSPVSYYCENQHGQVMPFCILLYFFHLRSSLAIHLLPPCLHNCHFYWLCIISSNNKIYRNCSWLWTLKLFQFSVTVKGAAINIFVNITFCFGWLISSGNWVSFDYLLWKMLWQHFFLR